MEPAITISVFAVIIFLFFLNSRVRAVLSASSKILLFVAFISAFYFSGAAVREGGQSESSRIDLSGSGKSSFSYPSSGSVAGLSIDVPGEKSGESGEDVIATGLSDNALRAIESFFRKDGGKIDTKDIAFHGIKAGDLDTESVTSRVIRDGAVRSEDLSENISIDRLTVDGLTVEGTTDSETISVSGNVSLSESSYINWGNMSGEGGLGFRDHSGKLQFRNDGGGWTDIGSGSGGIAIGNDVASSVPGSVFFAGVGGTLSQDNGNLFWNATDHRLGIGTGVPSTMLDVNGVITSTGGNSTNWNTAYGWGNHAGAGYLASSSYTAADVLAKLLTVDGAASSLDADTLDGHDSAYFQTALSNPVTGTGLSGHVPYWNTSGTLTYDADGNLYWDATNNRFGIGTTSPGGILDVQGGTAAAGLDGTDITLTAQSGAAGGHRGGSVYLNAGSGSSSWPSGVVEVANATQFNVVRNGNDGYASSNSGWNPYPSVNTMFRNGYSFDGTTAINLFNVRNASTLQQYGYFGAVSVTGASNYGPAFVWGQSTAGDAYTERMRLDSAGNFGIGTTNPGQRLSVAGTLGIVETGSTPTYYSIFQGGDQSANITYTLPVSSTNGLLKNTSGTLSWDTSTYLTANQSITLSGDVSGSGTTSITTAIGTDKITEPMLKAVNSPTDEYCLTYEATVGDFEWQTCGSGGGMSIGSSVASATQGSILFAGSAGVLAQDNANFFWDETNHRLGLGTASPGYTFDAKGANTLATIGSEMVSTVADRDFSSSTGNWTGTNWNIGSGVATHIAGANTYVLSNAALSSAPVSGRAYQVSFAVTTGTAGTLNIAVGSASYGAMSSPSGTYTILIVATGTGALTFTPDATWAGTIDNVSVKELTLSDAVMALRNTDNSVALELRGSNSTVKGTFFGYQSGRGVSGVNNAFFGYQSGMNATTGSDNSAFGYQALYANTTGIRNTALGQAALKSSTAGSSNVAVGYGALTANNVSDNTAIGTLALTANTTGTSNVGVGANALQFNPTGNYNTAVGHNAGKGSSGYTTTANTFVGYNAGSANQTNRNVMIGYSTGSSATTGGNNILIGYSAGDAITTGGTNILIGYDIDAQSATGSSQLSIGNVIFGTGGFGTGTTVGAGSIGIGNVSPSYRLHVSIGSTGDVAGFTNTSGTCTINPTSTALSCSSDAALKRDIVALSSMDSLSAVNRLRPVSFRWKSGSDSDPLRIGLIAQEVEGVFPDLVSVGPDGKKAVNYLGLLPYALSAIQEQQAEISNLSGSLSGLILRTDRNIATVGELQTSVDDQLSVIGDSMRSLDEKQVSFQGKLTTLDDRVLSAEALLSGLVPSLDGYENRIGALEADMASLREEHAALIDFYRTFELGSAVMSNADGDVDLLDGKLSAKVVGTGELVIEVRDPDVSTIGTATIYPVAKDGNDDGKDDYSGLPISDSSVVSRDGKSITIRTKAVSKSSRIFITPDVAVPIAVTEKSDGKSFTVSTKDAVSEKILFDWMIIRESAENGGEMETGGGR